MTVKTKTLLAIASTLLALVGVSAIAVLATGHLASAQVSKAELDATSTPDKVETPIGTLEFFDGVPTDSTVATVYDNLDRTREVQVQNWVWGNLAAPWF